MHLKPWLTAQHTSYFNSSHSWHSSVLKPLHLCMTSHFCFRAVSKKQALLASNIQSEVSLPSQTLVIVRPSFCKPIPFKALSNDDASLETLFFRSTFFPMPYWSVSLKVEFIFQGCCKYFMDLWALKNLVFAGCFCFSSVTAIPFGFQAVLRYPVKQYNAFIDWQ